MREGFACGGKKREKPVLNLAPEIRARGEAPRAAKQVKRLIGKAESQRSSGRRQTNAADYAGSKSGYQLVLAAPSAAPLFACDMSRTALASSGLSPGMADASQRLAQA